MSQHKQLERRSFPRRLLNFYLEVEGVTAVGGAFQDRGHLVTISGNGALFHSSRGEAYFLDQLLDISVELPGTPDVLGRMETVARVRRIDLQESAGRDSSVRGARIAVSFEHPLKLRRPDISPEVPRRGAQ